MVGLDLLGGAAIYIWAQGLGLRSFAYPYRIGSR
jgi:hypothetical protein